MRKIAVLLVAVIVTAYAITPAFAQVAVSPTFSGRTIGVSITTPTTAITTFADTGELTQCATRDPQGQIVNNALVQAQANLAFTTACPATVQSEAVISNVVLLPGSLAPVSIDFIRARSIASIACPSDVSTTFEIGPVRVGTVPINVSNDPDQTITIPGVGTLTLHEEINSPNGVTVIAAHLRLFTGQEVIIGKVTSSIICPPAGGAGAPPSGGEITRVECTFVTGGGFIDGRVMMQGNGKANFGFNARPNLNGHLNYQDHTMPGQFHVKMIQQTSFECLPKCPDNPNPPFPSSQGARQFTGTASINGQTGFTLTVCVEDNGEPGNAPSGADWFSIAVGSYQNAGILQGGNIQVHRNA